MKRSKRELLAIARATLKLFSFALLALHYFSWGLLLYPLYRTFPNLLYPFLAKYTQKHAAVLARILNLRIELSEDDAAILKNTQGVLLAANHLSYLDVIALMSLTTYRFVTSVEVKRTFFLGHITQLAGCLFVERRNKQNIHQEIRQMTESLGRGENVFFFPEATSTNGACVLRFKTPLFQSAIDSGANVLPMALRYLSISGRSVTVENRDTVCWYGDMTFFNHFWSVLKENSVLLGIRTGTMLQASSQQTNIQLAEKAQKIVTELYDSPNWPIPKPLETSKLEFAV